MDTLTRRFTALSQVDHDGVTYLADPTPADRARHADAMRCFATALTHIESGQMFAVKGVAATLRRDG